MQGDENVHSHTMKDGTVITHTHGKDAAAAHAVQEPGAAGHSHGHTHTHQNTKAVLNRLARAAGHLEKVRDMVARGEDCSEVLVQLSAVISALNGAGKLILKDHMEHCMVDAVHSGDMQMIEELSHAIDRFISV